MGEPSRGGVAVTTTVAMDDESLQGIGARPASFAPVLEPGAPFVLC